MSAERGTPPESVAVVGAGSWGTALAILLSRKGHRVRLWALEPAVERDAEMHRENRTYLPGAMLPEALEVTGNLETAVSGCPFVISVSPSQFVRDVMGRAAPHLHPEVTIVSASKGIETATLERMDQVFEALLTPAQTERFSVLSGPSFAKEVADEQPTAVVAASRSEPARKAVQRLFQKPYFRVYTTPDVVGVELGGALKNVIALAAGVVAGLGFGHNTQAALMTRGLAEITRLGLAMGANRATFAGLAGMGDLVLTCTGELSRNRTVGVRLGRGEQLDSILGHMSAVAEGVKTCTATVALARVHGVDMPIAEEVHAILTEGRRPAEAVRNLMLRDPKPEEWS